MSTLYNCLADYLRHGYDSVDPSILKTKADLKDLEFKTIGKVTTEYISTKANSKTTIDSSNTEISEEKKTNFVPFSKTIDFNNKDFRKEISKAIQKESNVVASQLFEILYDFIELLQKYSDYVMIWLKDNFEEGFREKLEIVN